MVCSILGIVLSFSRKNLFLISNSDISKDLGFIHHLFLFEQAKDGIIMSLAVFPASRGVVIDLGNILNSIDFSSSLYKGSTCYLLGHNVIIHAKPISGRERQIFPLKYVGLGVFRTLKLFCMILWIHIIIYLSKFMVCTIKNMNPNLNCGS